MKMKNHDDYMKDLFEYYQKRINEAVEYDDTVALAETLNSIINSAEHWLMALQLGYRAEPIGMFKDMDKEIKKFFRPYRLHDYKSVVKKDEKD